MTEYRATTILQIPGYWLAKIAQYWVPAGLLLFSLLAIATFEFDFEQAVTEPAKFRWLEDVEGKLDVANAKRRLEDSPSDSRVATNLSTAPWWIRVELVDAARHVDFESRHATNLDCWDAVTENRVGQANRDSVSGLLRAADGGFVFDVPNTAVAGDQVICRMTFSGPARITVQMRTSETQYQHQRVFERYAGLLEGSFFMLALIVLIAAIFLQDQRYLLLSMWLIFNLRVAGISVGWDQQWLGMLVPAEWIHEVRQITISTYIVLTYALFAQVFEKELRAVAIGWLLCFGQVTALMVGVAALILPYAVYLPVMWVFSTISILVMFICLVYIGIFQRSPIVGWYSVAMVIVFLGSYVEVMAAAFGAPVILEYFNSVTAAIGSSVFATLALMKQMRLERQQRISAEKDLTRIYHSTPVGLFTLNRRGQFVSGNKVSDKLFAGRPLGAVGHLLKAGAISSEANDELPQLSDYLSERDWKTLQDSGQVEALLDQSNDSDDRWVQIRIAQRGQYWDGSIQDVTERVVARNQLQYLALHDSLTNLLSRNGIDRFLRDQADSAGRERIVAVAYFNLSDFRRINAIYRNQAGDAVLKQVAERLRVNLPQSYRIARLAADEFVALGIGENVDEVIRRLTATHTELDMRAYQYAEQVFDVKVRGAIIELPAEMPGSDAITLAQSECNRDSGKAWPIVHRQNSSIFTAYHKQRELIRQFGEATLPVGLMLYIQPIISVRKPDQTLNFEVLLRMIDEQGDNVTVDKVIEAAELSGNMPRLDCWVLEQTLDWMSRNQSALENTAFVSVNLSGASLNDASFWDKSFQIMDSYPQVIDRLCLEITEGVALSDFNRSNDFINALEQRNVRVSIDDFGAGYSSYAYVRNLRAHSLKIDRSFIVGIEEDVVNVEVTRSIVQLGSALGMPCVAEGVEKLNVYESLADIDTDYVQGYLISKPVPIDKVIGHDSALSFVEDQQLRSRLSELAQELNQRDMEFADYSSTRH